MDKFSYALGMSTGNQLLGSGISEISSIDFANGVAAMLNGGEFKVSIEEANKVIAEFFQKKQEEEEKKNADFKKASEGFLKEYAQCDGVKITETGLMYKVINEGNGKQPNGHSYVTCHYEGKLSDGSVFDSSYKRGEPATFSLEQVIPGWTEGLQLMKEGAKYEFCIPADLGYGAAGVPGVIPPFSTLIFTVELLKA